MKKVDEIPADRKKELLQWMVNIEEEFPKLYLYSEFWQKFYTIAKYGDEELGFPPERLFGMEEAKLAVEHARRCRELASRLQNYFKAHPGKIG